MDEQRKKVEITPEVIAARIDRAVNEARDYYDSHPIPEGLGEAYREPHYHVNDAIYRAFMHTTQKAMSEKWSVQHYGTALGNTITNMLVEFSMNCSRTPEDSILMASSVLRSIASDLAPALEAGWNHVGRPIVHPPAHT